MAALSAFTGLSGLTIRARVTLWQTLAMAAVLAAFAGGVYLYVRESLFAQIDARLEAHLGALEATLRKGIDEYYEISEFDRHGVLNIYRIVEGPEPLYRSGLWVAAELDGAIQGAGRTIWPTARRGVFHLRRTSLDLEGRRFEIAVGEEAGAVHRTLGRLALALSIGLPLGLLATVLGAHFLAGRMLQPLGEMARRAEAIGADHLSERLVVGNPKDEVGRLAAVLNETFGRLEGSFERLRRFTQDASHELRTPLAVLRSVGEAGVQSARSSDDLREVIGSMLEESDRLARLIEGLLTLARADAGHALGERRRFDLSELAREVVDCLQVLAEDKRQAIDVEAAQPLEVHADRDALRLALMNLLSNAVRYTPAGGRIAVRAAPAAPGEVALEVEDSGPGIAAEHQARLFERFYRVDSGRGRAEGGFGLGLAIARWAVEANGGRIELESEPGRGSVFRMVFGHA